jgi:hypothetical protein
MIEILLILSFLFLIYAFFYKQVNKQYSINQIPFEKMEKLNELLYDRLPIIIKDVPLCSSVTPIILLDNPRFSKFLGEFLEKRDPFLPNNKEFQSYFANESGFHVFGERMWKQYLYTTPVSEYVSSMKSSLFFQNTPLSITTAIFTLFIPINGTFVISLINKEYEKSLPSDYKALTTIESIVSENQIQYIDIILKVGNVLLLPAHWYYLIKEKEPYSYYGVHEYHEPISILMNYLEKN